MAHSPHTYSPGDLVQPTRLYVKRQNKATYPEHIKTDDTKGRFVRYNGHVYHERHAKHPTCMVAWFKDTFPYEFEQRVRLDYIEPLGTPR